ncbi:FAD binding domain-containing protein [Roseateles koreensis]|uniref:Xanthine dehydrogenase family protein subunit M n=1 Tax=Roseateles koreensis TaxID=2987526 RepID=A0ABT5KS43_9BURK|nr:xanthine dehydrogenase family protein subunit M [Roseateles koreensis]MDC8785255.1 xanthine dehydrogenase family protein subunit M [Roseateles koreensis]
MRDFEYCRPSSLADVLALLRDGADSKLLAGGQSLLGAMKLGLMAPERIVDLAGVPELQGGCRVTRDHLTLGAMQTHASLARNAALQAWAPGLADLAGHIADEQVRSMGTIGGSLANADPSACWPAAMLAVGASLVTDRRTVEVDDYFCGLFSTALEPDEVLCGLRLRRPRRFAYLKHEQAASRFALVGVAISQFDQPDLTGTTVRVALTGTAQGAVRLPAFEQALSRDFSPDALKGLSVDADLMSSDVHGDAHYRAHLAAVVARRAVSKAIEIF